jgi:hypothetical protein
MHLLGVMNTSQCLRKLVTQVKYVNKLIKRSFIPGFHHHHDHYVYLNQAHDCKSTPSYIITVLGKPRFTVGLWALPSNLFQKPLNYVYNHNFITSWRQRLTVTSLIGDY